MTDDKVKYYKVLEDLGVLPEALEEDPLGGRIVLGAREVVLDSGRTHRLVSIKLVRDGRSSALFFVDRDDLLRMLVGADGPVDVPDELLEEMGRAGNALEARAKAAEEAAEKLRKAHSDVCRDFNALKTRLEDLEGDNVRRADGKEVEELRSAIERLVQCDEPVDPDELQVLLDEVDARDSLAYLEGRVLEDPEPACMFSETVDVDVRFGLLEVPARFINKHCEIIFRARYPIGPPAEVSKPEGRDS